MSMAQQLAEGAGLYIGVGDGAESGPFVARIEVRRLPNGAVSIDYEAMSREEGLQHSEHSVLCAGPHGRDRLTIAHAESPFLTEMVAAEPGGNRFVQREPFGPYTMEVVLEVPESGRITYAWWWAEAGQAPVEQSRADALLVSG